MESRYIAVWQCGTSGALYGTLIHDCQRRWVRPRIYSATGMITTAAAGRTADLVVRGMFVWFRNFLPFALPI